MVFGRLRKGSSPCTESNVVREENNEVKDFSHLVETAIRTVLDELEGNV